MHTKNPHESRHSARMQRFHERRLPGKSLSEHKWFLADMDDLVKRVQDFERRHRSIQSDDIGDALDGVSNYRGRMRELEERGRGLYADFEPKLAPQAHKHKFDQNPLELREFKFHKAWRALQDVERRARAAR